MKKHKILGLFAVLLSLLMMTSCGKDDEETKNEDIILGTWTMSKIDIIPTAFDVVTSFEALGLTNPADGFLGQTITFTFQEGGGLEASFGGDVRTGTWALLENDTKIRLSNIFKVEDFGSELVTQEFLTQVETFDLVTLTNSAMDIQSTVELEVSDPSLPVPVPVSIAVNVSFTK